MYVWRIFPLLLRWSLFQFGAYSRQYGCSIKDNFIDCIRKKGGKNKQKIEKKSSSNQKMNGNYDWFVTLAQIISISWKNGSIQSKSIHFSEQYKNNKKLHFIFQFLSFKFFSFKKKSLMIQDTNFFPLK